jgi:acyl-CoA reductase-like NAD-dependent aldehyde dehydrogenase
MSVAGKDLQEEKMLEVTSPFDGEVIANVAYHTPQEAMTMLDRAQVLYADKDGWLAPHARIAILEKLANLLAKQAGDFALLIAQEGGKPLADAQVEVTRAIDGIHLAVKELSHVMRGEEIPMGLTKATENRLAFTTYEPIGVVMAISAFNHPLNLIVHQVVPAIAVGCPVMVKPAGSTPLCCLRFCELVQQAGLPDGWCQPVICDNETAQMLVSSEKIAFFSFIGSAKVGWYLRSKLAAGTRCALEHGGVAPVIIDKSADMDLIIPALLKGGFYHAGQVCVSVQRIYVPDAMAETLAQKLADGAEKLLVGDPAKPDTQVGPLISKADVKRVDEWVQQAVKAGAKLVCGGKALSETTYAPSVLLNPPADATVSTSEIFGPVVCVYSYTDRHEAIARANSLPFAFQAAVFTNDLNMALDTVKRLDASAVMVNDHTAFRSDWMPFAGQKKSGYGTGGIGYSMHDMIQAKMTVIHLPK